MEIKYNYPKCVIPLLLVFFLLLFTIFLFPQEKKENPPKISIENLFYATGWMGDGQYGVKFIRFNGASSSNPHSKPTCIRIDYTFGPLRWAGVYWLNRPDNWGDQPGNNYLKKGYKKITFWAKGVTGKEIIEFKVGGVKNLSKKFSDSFEVTLGKITLSKNWQEYSLDLSGQDLSSVIGGFCWVANEDFNQAKGITFFLDDIYLE